MVLCILHDSQTILLTSRFIRVHNIIYNSIIHTYIGGNLNTPINPKKQTFL